MATLRWVGFLGGFLMFLLSQFLGLPLQLGAGCLKMATQQPAEQVCPLVLDVLEVPEV